MGAFQAGVDDGEMLVRGGYRLFFSLYHFLLLFYEKGMERERERM